MGSRLQLDHQWRDQFTHKVPKSQRSLSAFLQVTRAVPIFHPISPRCLLFNCVLPPVTLASRPPVLSVFSVKLSGCYCQQLSVYFRLSICCYWRVSFSPTLITQNLFLLQFYFWKSYMRKQRPGGKQHFTQKEDFFLCPCESRKINVFQSHTTGSFEFLL
jgi:hypothetical protein